MRWLRREPRPPDSLSLGMYNNAEKYRRNAEQAREQADQAISELDKKMWLRIAEEWIKLANAADELDRK